MAAEAQVDEHPIVVDPDDARQSPVDNAARRRADKVARRRDELAHATLKTLASMGYAQTSMRDIAANSGYSHGVLHYYFADKVDLILHCVRAYKAECVTRYDELIDTATTREEFAAGFPDRLAETLREDNEMHRLWYDIRSQSVFEPVLAPDVEAIDAMLEQMIWRVMTRYAALANGEIAVDSPTAYAAFDGIFARALMHVSHGDPEAPARLKLQSAALLDRLVI